MTCNRLNPDLQTTQILAIGTKRIQSLVARQPTIPPTSHTPFLSKAPNAHHLVLAIILVPPTTYTASLHSLNTTFTKLFQSHQFFTAHHPQEPENPPKELHRSVSPSLYLSHKPTYTRNNNNSENLYTQSLLTTTVTIRKSRYSTKALLDHGQPYPKSKTINSVFPTASSPTWLPQPATRDPGAAMRTTTTTNDCAHGW